MSESFHGREVMQLMVRSGQTHTEESYLAAVQEHFGADATFFNCSADGMTPLELLDFFRSRGKVLDVEDGFRFGACGHGHGHGHGGCHH